TTEIPFPDGSSPLYVRCIFVAPREPYTDDESMMSVAPEESPVTVAPSIFADPPDPPVISSVTNPTAIIVIKPDLAPPPTREIDTGSPRVLCALVMNVPL